MVNMRHLQYLCMKLCVSVPCLAGFVSLACCMFIFKNYFKLIIDNRNRLIV